MKALSSLFYNAIFLAKLQLKALHEWWAAMAEWLRRLTRNQMGSSRVGSNPTRSVWMILKTDHHNELKKVALSGNRTPVSRVAGENSTTEPTMLGIFDISFEGEDVQMTFVCKYAALQNWPRWGSNPQSSDSKSDALSIGPRGRCMFVKIWCNYLWQHETLLRQWHWITITRCYLYTMLFIRSFG